MLWAPFCYEMVAKVHLEVDSVRSEEFLMNHGQQEMDGDASRTQILGHHRFDVSADSQ